MPAPAINQSRHHLSGSYKRPATECSSTAHSCLPPCPALQWYVLLRQHYLTMGDSLTPWLNQQTPDAQQQAARTTSSGVVEVAIVSDQRQQQEKEQQQQQQETGAAGDSGSGVAVKARALVRRDTQKALMEVETLLLVRMAGSLIAMRSDEPEHDNRHSSIGNMAWS